MQFLTEVPAEIPLSSQKISAFSCRACSYSDPLDSLPPLRPGVFPKQAITRTILNTRSWEDIMCLKTESNQRACYNCIHRNSILQSSKNEGSLLFTKEHDHMSRKEKHSIWEVGAARTLLSKAKMFTFLPFRLNWRLTRDIPPKVCRLSHSGSSWVEKTGSGSDFT